MKRLPSIVLRICGSFMTVVLFGGGSLMLLQPALAEVLNSVDFEKDALSSWNPFFTRNGTDGGNEWPRVVFFETKQEGHPSLCLTLKVGQVRYDPDQDPQQGAGLGLTIHTDDGRLALSVDVAVTYESSTKKRNLAGGLFEWMVDGQVVASHDVGPIENHAIVRHHLQALHPVKSGSHSVQLRVTRPFVSHSQQEAPFQYLDNLLVVFQPHP